MKSTRVVFVSAIKKSRPVVLILIFGLLAFCKTYGFNSITSNSTGGVFNLTTTWAGGVAPAAGDTVIINTSAGNSVTFTISTAALGPMTVTSGSTLLVSQAINCAGLTVDGIVQFSGATARTLTVNGNVVIDPSGSILPASSGSTVFNLSVGGVTAGGNFINNGIFNGGSGSSKINTIFTFASNNTFSTSSSATTNFNTITLAKTAITNTLDFIPDPASTFSVPPGFLTIASGSFEMDGTASVVNTFFASAAYSIPATGGFWLNNPNVTVIAQAGSPTLSGLLKISNGTFYAGTTAAHIFTANASSTLTMTGGALNISGRLQLTTATAVFTQTGGVITVATTGNNVASSASFSSIGTVAFNGGSIAFQNASSGTTPLDYNITQIPTVSTTSPTLLQFGNASTPAGAVFNVQSYTPNITLSNINNPGIVLSGTLKVYGDINLYGSGSFNKAAYSLTMAGLSAINAGSIFVNGANTLTLNASSTAANGLFFTSSFGNQFFTAGSGTIFNNELPSVTINNTFTNGKVIIQSGLAMAANTTLTLTSGIMSAGSSIQFGSNVTAGTFTCLRTLGSLTATTSSFGSQVTSSSYTYNGAATQTTGAEIPTSSPATITNLTVNNASLNLTLNNAVIVSGTLALTSGVVNTTDINLLTLGSAGTGTLTGGPAASYVNGPFARTFNASRNDAPGLYNLTTLYPIAKNGLYMPVYVDPVTGAGGYVTVKIEIINDGAPAWLTPIVYGQYLEMSRDFQITLSGPGSVVSYNIGANTATGTYVAPTPQTGNAYYLVIDQDGTGNYINGGGTVLTNSSTLWTTVYSSTGTNGLSSTILPSGSRFTLATFVVSGIAMYHPGGVHGSTLWLRADNGPDATISGGSLNTWYDQSGNTNNGTKASGNYTQFQAGNTSSGMNFNPAVNFSGAGLNLAKSDIGMGITTSSTFTLFAVTKQTQYGRLMGGPSYGFEFDVDITAFVNTSIAGLSNNPTTTSDNKPYIETYLRASTNFNNDFYTFVNADNALANANAGGGPQFSAAPGSSYVLGYVGYYGSGTNGFVGSASEVIIFPNDLLTSGDLPKVHSYLALKYGISLNQNVPQSYIASDGVTKMWDAGFAATGFNHNIFGIGRDDSSALYQKIAQSANTGDVVTMALPQQLSTSYGYDFASTNNSSSRTSTLNNRNFETIADNGGTATWNSPIISGMYKTLNREWQVQQVGTVGTVALQFDMNNASFTMPALLCGTSYYLIYTDATGNYNAGTVAQLASTAPGIWSTLPGSAINFANGSKFTIATLISTAIVNHISPGGVGEANGMQLWLRSDAGLTTSGSNVTSWANQAQASVIPMTTQPAAVAGNPTISQGAYNYNPSVLFDGNSYFTGTMTNTPPLGTALSFAVVNGNDYNYTNAAGIFSLDDGNVSTNGDIIINSSGQYGNDASGITYYPTDWTLSPNNPYIVGSDYDAFSLKNSYVRVNGRVSSVGTTPSLSPPAADGTFHIGYRSGPGPRVYAGDIAEVVYYINNNFITAAQKNKIESYLALKYGITLDNTGGGTAGNYTLSNGTNAWTASVNPTFQRAVVALVRDDTSALMQKQSHTQDDSLRVFMGNLSANNQVNGSSITNDHSSIVIGNDGGRLRSSGDKSVPSSGLIIYRLDRVWKVTNTNFTDNFGIEIKWDSIGNFNIGDLRLLVSDYPNDFTNATVYSSYDVNFYIGSIIVKNIGNAIIPIGATKYITIGSASAFTTLSAGFLQFTATPVDNKLVKLYWTTGSEDANDYFTIERSADGNNWEPVTTVNSTGNSSAAQNYNAQDQNPFTGVSYYRIKQTSADEKYTYSQVRKIMIGQTGNNIVSIYPNPATDQITVKGSAQEIKKVKLYTITGLEITNSAKQVMNSSTEMVVDLSTLPKGIYMIKTATTSNKVIKQ